MLKHPLALCVCSAFYSVCAYACNVLIHGIIAATVGTVLLYVSLFCKQVTPIQVSLATCSD